MFMCSVSTVYAYNTYNQHKLTYGVGNYGKDTQHYFITSSASGYASYINTAMSEWVNTTSSMGVTTLFLIQKPQHNQVVEWIYIK